MASSKRDTLNYEAIARAVDAATGSGSEQADYNRRMVQHAGSRAARTTKSGRVRKTTRQAGRQFAKASHAAEKKASKGGGGGGGDILGEIGSIVGSALETVDVPRSVIQSTVADVADAAGSGDSLGVINALNPINLGRKTAVGVGAATGVNIGGADDLYNKKRYGKDLLAHTGAGTYFQRALKDAGMEDTWLNNEWLKRGIGFAGDVGSDPLTYVGGAGVLAHGAESAAGEIARTGAKKLTAEAVAKAGIEATDNSAAAAIARKGLRVEAEKQAEGLAAKVVKGRGTSALSKEELKTLFGTTGGLKVRVPGTGRLVGKAFGREGGAKELTILPKEITDLITKPGRAAKGLIGDSRMGNALAEKLGGANPELRKMLRSGDPEKIVQALKSKDIFRTASAKAEAGLRLLPDAKIAGKEVGANGLGPRAMDVYTSHIRKLAQKDPEALIHAVETGNFSAVEGGQEVKDFLYELHRAAVAEGVPLAKRENYFPRWLTAEAKAERGAKSDIGGLGGKFTGEKGRINEKIAQAVSDAGGEAIDVADEAKIRQAVEEWASREMPNLKGNYYETNVNKLLPHYVEALTDRVRTQNIINRMQDEGIVVPAWIEKGGTLKRSAMEKAEKALAKARKLNKKGDSAEDAAKEAATHAEVMRAVADQTEAEAKQRAQAQAASVSDEAFATMGGKGGLLQGAADGEVNPANIDWTDPEAIRKAEQEYIVNQERTAQEAERTRLADLKAQEQFGIDVNPEATAAAGGTPDAYSAALESGTPSPSGKDVFGRLQEMRNNGDPNNAFANLSDAEMEDVRQSFKDAYDSGSYEGGVKQKGGRYSNAENVRRQVKQDTAFEELDQALESMGMRTRAVKRKGKALRGVAADKSGALKGLKGKVGDLGIHPADMTPDEFAQAYAEAEGKVAAAEKVGTRADWTPEQQALYDSGDWEAFSRSRGYTEAEINDFQHWLDLNGHGQGFNYDDVSPEAIHAQHVNGPAAGPPKIGQHEVTESPLEAAAREAAAATKASEHVDNRRANAALNRLEAPNEKTITLYRGEPAENVHAARGVQFHRSEAYAQKMAGENGRVYAVEVPETQVIYSERFAQRNGDVGAHLPERWADVASDVGAGAKRQKIETALDEVLGTSPARPTGEVAPHPDYPHIPPDHPFHAQVHRYDDLIGQGMSHEAAQAQVHAELASGQLGGAKPLYSQQASNDARKILNGSNGKNVWMSDAQDLALGQNIPEGEGVTLVLDQSKVGRTRTNTKPGSALSHGKELVTDSNGSANISAAVQEVHVPNVTQDVPRGSPEWRADPHAGLKADLERKGFVPQDQGDVTIWRRPDYNREASDLARYEADANAAVGQPHNIDHVHKEAQATADVLHERRVAIQGAVEAGAPDEQVANAIANLTADVHSLTERIANDITPLRHASAYSGADVVAPATTGAKDAAFENASGALYRSQRTPAAQATADEATGVYGAQEAFSADATAGIEGGGAANDPLAGQIAPEGPFTGGPEFNSFDPNAHLANDAEAGIAGGGGTGNPAGAPQPPGELPGLPGEGGFPQYPTAPQQPGRESVLQAATAQESAQIDRRSFDAGLADAKAKLADAEARGWDTTYHERRIEIYMQAQHEADPLRARQLQFQADALDAMEQADQLHTRANLLKDNAQRLQTPKVQYQLRSELDKSMARLNIDDTLAAPNEIADILNRVGKVNSSEGVKKFLKHYDQALNYIKAWQIATPGFHVRNFMGGMFNNYLAGIDAGAYRRFVRDRDLFLSGKLTEGPRAEAMRTLLPHVGSAQYSAFEVGGMESIKASQRINPLSKNNLWLTGNRKVGGKVEEVLRGSLGYDRLLKGQTLDEAVADIMKYHFDYQDLSRFERGTVKRVIPFYTWTRHNLPLQMEQYLLQPGKYARYWQAKKEIEMGQHPEGVVPSYFLNEGFGIHTPFHFGGGDQYLTPDLPFTTTVQQALPDLSGVNPSAPGTYLSALEGYASMATPILKTPVERAMNRQYFKGIPFQDKKLKAPQLWNDMPGVGEALRAVGMIDGKGKITDRDLYTVEQYLPLLARMRRLGGGTKKDNDRMTSSWMSFIGIPLKTNTPYEQQLERYRRKFKSGPKPNPYARKY